VTDERLCPSSAHDSRVPFVWVYIILVLLLLLDAAAMFLHFTRIAINDQIGQIEKVINGICLTLTLMPVMVYARFSRRESMVFLMLAGYAFILGLFRGHVLSRPFIGQLYHWTIMAGGFSLGYAAYIDRLRLERLVRVMSYGILFSSAIGYLVLERFRISMGVSLYVGYPSSQLMLPFAQFALAGAWVSVITTLLLFLAAGKRGPLLAMLIGGVFVFLLKRFRSSVSATFGVLLLVGVVGWTALAGLRIIVEEQVFPAESVLMRVATKWNTTFNFSDNLTAASSGRDVEIEAAWDLVDKPSTFTFGQGFGWSWDNYGEQQHYVHMSYMNFLVTYGIFGAILIFGILLRRIYALQRYALLHADEPLPWLLLFFLITNLINAATAGVLAVSLFFWTALGISARLTTEFYDQATPISGRSPHGELSV
jgi:hypothetical protein